MRESVLLTRLFAGVNLLVLAFVTVAGFIKGNLRNWELMAHDYLLAESRLNGTHRWLLGPGLGSGMEPRRAGSITVSSSLTVWAPLVKEASSPLAWLGSSAGRPRVSSPSLVSMSSPRRVARPLEAFVFVFLVWVSG